MRRLRDRRLILWRSNRRTRLVKKLQQRCSYYVKRASNCGQKRQRESLGNIRWVSGAVAKTMPRRGCSPFSMNSESTCTPHCRRKQYQFRCELPSQPVGEGSWTDVAARGNVYYCSNHERHQKDHLFFLLGSAEKGSEIRKIRPWRCQFSRLTVAILDVLVGP